MIGYLFVQKRKLVLFQKDNIANSDNETGIQTVADFMTPVEKLVCVTEDFGIGACILMRENTIRHLPVVKSDENAIVINKIFLALSQLKIYCLL